MRGNFICDKILSFFVFQDNKGTADRKFSFRIWVANVLIEKGE